MTPTAGSGHRRRSRRRHHHHYQQSLLHLLELTIISAQDLHPTTRSMRTYAIAYINPKLKLYTRIDPAGRTNPSWNDKFVFRLDDAFLRSYTSSVTVDIYASRRYSSDALLGTARIVLSTFLRPSSAATSFIALQVRRPRSLRPQGILNVGLALVDPHMKSAPAIYASAVRAVAFAHKDLIGGQSLKDAVGAPHAGGGEESDGHQERRLEKRGSVEVGGWVVEKEMKTLNSKLEKWRKELPAPAPAPAPPPAEGGRSRRRRSSRRGLFSCFCRGKLRREGANL